MVGLFSSGYSVSKLHNAGIRWLAAPRGKDIRRGTRIPCEISASLKVPDHEAGAAEPCDIILVNPYGCAIRFYRPLNVGAPVYLEGLPASAQVDAKVVTCISMGKFENFWLLGLSLNSPGNVWGIPNPPTDWEA